MNNNYYVYLHRKETDGTIFYVGKGKDHRAWSFRKRSALWNKIKNKYGVKVEILEYNLREWYAYELETELILRHGRVDNKTGTLANLSDGGEGGASGVRLSEQQRLHRSTLQKGSLGPRFDSTIYSYYNMVTKETVNCLQSEFNTKYRPARHFLTRESHSKFWIDPERYSEEYEKKVIAECHGNGNGNKYSKKLRSFVEIATGDTIKMTFHEFEIRTGRPPTCILYKSKSSARSVCGFTTQELIDEYGLERIRTRSRGVFKDKPFIDETEYSFINLLTLDVVKHTRRVFEKSYGVKVGNLFKSNPNKKSGCWSLYSTFCDIGLERLLNPRVGKNSTNYDDALYSFKNIKTGECFVWVRLDFEAKYKIPIKCLFSKAQNNITVNNWTLAK